MIVQRISGVLTASLVAFVCASANAASFSVKTSGTGDCSAVGEGLPADITQSTPGATVSHSRGFGDDGQSEFESWFAQSNQQELRTRSRASQGGFNESPAQSCAGATAILKIEDLEFTSLDEDIETVDVSLDIRYDGTLTAFAEGGLSSGSAKLFNSVILGGQQDQSGNTSGLEIFNQANRGIFEVNCFNNQCTNQNNTVIAQSGEGEESVEATSIVDIVLTHTWTNVPINTLVSLELGIQSTSGVIKNFNDGGSATSDFANTVFFANPGAVFGLADGITANSFELGLTNNSFATPVPVPAALPLLITALTGLGLLRLKRSKAA